MVTRRQAFAWALASALARPALAASAQRQLRALHKKTGGRLGVHILDSQSGRRIGYDDDSRYAMASTFKLPLAAALLWQVDRGAFPLTRELAIGQDDLLYNSPAVEAQLKAGKTAMSVQELCAAIMIQSDNAAANVLLTGIGGPQTVTEFMRHIGDQQTRMDRRELELNSNIPGDPRDTTTPRAMVDAMLQIFTQSALKMASRALLIDWMTRSRTGFDRVRAGLPKGWIAGDKSGTGQNGAVNDLVITYPPDRRPIFIAVYMSESTQDIKVLTEAHAEIGKLVGREKWK